MWQVPQYKFGAVLLMILIDTLSPDLEEDGFPVYQLLLSAGIYVIKNVANCHKLPPSGAPSLRKSPIEPVPLIDIKLIYFLFKRFISRVCKLDIASFNLSVSFILIPPGM